MTTIEGLDDFVEIGRGGFGVVYRATETELGRQVAVKVLPPLLEEGAQRRFDRERLALGAMSGHPHIVTIHRSGRTEEDAQPFLVMEYCERGSIGDEMERSGPLTWPRATEIVVKLAGALETAHRAGIVHRDIKPANVLVSNLDEPKLADFGIARVDGAPETQSTSITASLAHAAPEVLSGKRPDARSDVYSLASTLYELLTGVPAFVRPGDDSMLPILNRIALDPVPLLPSATAPSAVADVVTRAMAKEPEDRPATAAEFGRMLADAQRQSGTAPTAMMVEGAPSSEPSQRSVPDSSPPLGPLPNRPAAAGTGSGSTKAVDGPLAAPEAWAPRPATQARDMPEADTRSVAVADAAGRSPRFLFASVAGMVMVVGLAIAAIAALGANGESDGGDDATGATGSTTTATAPDTPGATRGAVAEELPATIVASEPLTLGALYPQSGDLASFGPPLLTATELAVEDVNEAGGVLGFDLELVSGDSIDQDEQQIRSEVTRFVDESVDVIVGPLTTFDSRVLIDDPAAENLVVISPAATGKDLTTLDSDDTFFRTAPSEVTMGHVTAQILIDGGIDRLALVHIDDPYGFNLSEEIRLRYAQLGGVVVVNTAYDPFGDVSSVAAELAGSDAEGIVVIGFNETVDILAALRADGIGPQADGTPVFGVDANFLLDGDPATIDGYRSIVAQIDRRQLGPFTARLEERGIENLDFTPEAYDAVIIAALAAQVSGVTSGPDLAAAVPGVTKDGEKCFSFPECMRLLSEGRDIDYDGFGGPYELTGDGDPRVASYVIVTYDGGTSPNDALNEYVFSR